MMIFLKHLHRSLHRFRSNKKDKSVSEGRFGHFSATKFSVGIARVQRDRGAGEEFRLPDKSWKLVGNGRWHLLRKTFKYEGETALANGTPGLDIEKTGVMPVFSISLSLSLSLRLDFLWLFQNG